MEVYVATITTHPRAPSILENSPASGKAFDFADLPSSLEIAKMRERLRERKPLLVWRAKHGKERAADGVRVTFPGADRVERCAKPVLVVGEDLIDTTRKIVERIAVRRKHARHRQRADRSQRTEKIAERVVARVGVEPNVRGDPREHVIAGEQDALRLVHENSVIVGVAGRPLEPSAPATEIELLAVARCG